MYSTTITPAFLVSVATVKFTNGTDITNYFKTKTGSDFITWFNLTIANKGNWSKIKMATDTNALHRFNLIWDQIPFLFGTSSINLFQFISLMSIINNETGGQLIPVTEKVGLAGNPGLAYAFNKIALIKSSYNTLNSNKTAFDLFHNADYKLQHGTLALANTLKDTTDINWKGEIYPTGMDTSTDPLKTGFIQEADFFKFRGRGFIQTTTRSNYCLLIDFIMHYTGTNTIIKQYQSKWQGKTTDTIATISSNKDWNELFQNTDLIIPTYAINLHNKAGGNYLGKINLQLGVDENIKKTGKIISGGKAYSELFLKRVIQIADALGN